MLDNDLFLNDLALAEFEADLKIEKEKSAYRNRSIVWEKIKQEKLSWLLVLLEQAYMTRQEHNWVVFGIENDNIEELIKKIRFVNQYLPDPSPKKQFELRVKLL